MDLEEKEQRYRFLYTKVDAELNKFKSLKNELDKKKQEISQLVASNSAEARIKFGKEDLYSKVNSYIGELENLKHYLSIELDKVVKQIALKKGLKEKYGDKVNVSGDDVSVVVYQDDDIRSIENKFNLSKKLVADLKSKMEEQD